MANDADGFDSGPDAPAADGGPDDPGWLHAALIPEDCAVDIAHHPERLHPRVAWADCGEGCRVWAGESMAFESAWTDGDRLLAAVRFDFVEEAQIVAALDTDIGTPITAIRIPSTAVDSNGGVCTLNGLTIGHGALSLSIAYSDWDAGGDVFEGSWRRILSLSLADPLGTATITGRVEDYRSSIGALRAGPGFVAANSDGAVAWHAAMGALTAVSTPLYPAGVQHVRAAGDAIVWESWDSRVAVAAWSEDGAARLIREVEGGDVRGLASDGTTLAWLEGTGYDTTTLRYAHVELWTGTFDGDVLRDARRVRDVPHHSSGELGAGYYVTQELDDENPESGLAIFIFYRLSDGARARFRPPDGYSAHKIIGLSRTDSLLQSVDTYYRVDPRTLDFEVP